MWGRRADVAKPDHGHGSQACIDRGGCHSRLHRPGFTDPASLLGIESRAELAVIKRLIAAFRILDLPVASTVNADAHAAQALVFREKVPLP